MKRREFLKGSALAAAGAALGTTAAQAGEDRPNVLLILVDQMRTPVWTRPGITPNIDRLAASGVSFSDHFVSAAPCSPSRACLVTGTYTTQNGMFTNCDFVEGNLQPSLDPRIPTLGHVFGKAGYQTPYRGKWHLTRRADRNKDDALLDYGFTGWKPPEAYFGGPPYCGKVFDPIYARRAVDFLQDPDSHKSPWHLVASLVNPHDICAAPRYIPQQKLKPIITPKPPDNWTDDLSTKPKVQREYLERYESVGGVIDVDDPDAWRRYLDYYEACLIDVDGHVGKILDALEESGQRENTIVVFTSDHGEMGGSHKLRTKGNFAYEEVMKVPLIFSWPGKITAGAETRALASNVDVMPTLMSLAGVADRPYQPGIDLSPVLADPTADSGRDHVLFHQDWEAKFTIGKEPEDNALYDNPSHVRAIRDRQWKYAFYFSPGRDDVERELYNLDDDPLEMTNLANDPGYQDKVRELHGRMMEEEDQLVREFELS